MLLRGFLHRIARLAYQASWMVDFSVRLVDFNARISHRIRGKSNEKTPSPGVLESNRW